MHNRIFYKVLISSLFFFVIFSCDQSAKYEQSLNDPLYKKQRNLSINKQILSSLKKLHKKSEVQVFGADIDDQKDFIFVIYGATMKDDSIWGDSYYAVNGEMIFKRKWDFKTFTLKENVVMNNRSFSETEWNDLQKIERNKRLLIAQGMSEDEADSSIQISSDAIGIGKDVVELITTLLGP